MIDWFDLWLPGLLGELADRVDPWLPPWLRYVLAIPFVALVFVSALTEWLLRTLLTPAKFLSRS
jgi:hypothetical protein